MILSNYQPKISKRIFPFCPKIVWDIKNGKYVLPKIKNDKLRKTLQNKELTIICYGDLLETFFSFSLLEAYNLFDTNIKLNWAGNSIFNDLVRINGIASIIDFDRNDLKRFTTPLFSDLNRNYYINSLYNYREVLTYYNYYGYHCKKPALFQIFSNSFMKWKFSYLPKLRFSFPNKNNFLQVKNKKIALIFPDDSSSFSLKTIPCFNKDKYFIFSLSKILKKENYEIIILSRNYKNYQNEFVNSFELSLENIFHYLNISNVILSSQIDFLLLGILFDKKIIFSYPLQKTSIREFVPDTNFSFLNGKYANSSKIVFCNDMSLKSIYENL